MVGSAVAPEVLEFSHVFVLCKVDTLFYNYYGPTNFLDASGNVLKEDSCDAVNIIKIVKPLEEVMFMVTRLKLN
ncbi:Hypothetical predicted protein [Octopus vulgaris]|uniref:Uncharacterized protein n=1 Tax=Octopus vulgaris TaxID=6645 RepID=A0AA36AVW0_OCTVU|nr:Hypothetical predicted protein [Octopus vulgaris]